MLMISLRKKNFKFQFYSLRYFALKAIYPLYFCIYIFVFPQFELIEAALVNRADYNDMLASGAQVLT
jgi:hypothetical protein